MCWAAATASAQTAAVPTGPITLEQALALAEARGEAMAIARAGVQRAQGEQVRARSGRLPQLSASASYDRALASEFQGIFDAGAGPACAPFAPNPAAPLADRVSEIERAIDCGAIGNPFAGELQLQGPDMGELVRLADRVAKVVREVPDAVDVGLSTKGQKPELDVQIDRGLAGRSASRSARSRRRCDRHSPASTRETGWIHRARRAT